MCLSSLVYELIIKHIIYIYILYMYIHIYVLINVCLCIRKVFHFDFKAMKANKH